eukprot:CAMPEP_0116942172 /NCGR_PEP_ID=MMETSP0467-20121206/34437_1 /TAXON_ID=283647 /ORGANISM="Mesodinium pulex, Strain SPMC105" /LENGTH=104 /DNA_ID=CAMNT_0004625119 /DNA_START=2253 /DNA_END=2567 /DNA_ORIENTATION=+
MPPSGKSKALEKKEELLAERQKQNEEFIKNKIKKLDDIQNWKKNIVQKVSLENDPSKEQANGSSNSKSKSGTQARSENQKKIDELKQKLFNVQIRMKNTGVKLN